MNNNNLSFFQRLRIILVSFLFLGTSRRSDFKCFDFVKKVFKIAKIPECDNFVNISAEQKENPPFGIPIFLLEKRSSNKRWSHVGIAIPFGYLLHMSLYWGKKVTITPLAEIWKRYNLAK